MHCVGESELAELTADSATELSDMLRARYPGVLTEYADSADEVDDEDDSRPPTPIWKIRSHPFSSLCWRTKTGQKRATTTVS